MTEKKKNCGITLTISGSGITFEREIDEGLAGQIMNFVLGKGDFSNAPPPIPHSNNFDESQPPPLSLSEFLEDSQPKRSPDIILCVAEYISKQKRKQFFAPDEISSEYPTATLSIPKTFLRDFRWAIANGWVAENPKEKGQFYITKTGKKAILEKFSPEIIKATPQSKLGGGKNKKMKSKDQ